MQDSASREASDATMSGSNSKLDDTDDTFVSLGPTDYFEGAAKIFDHNGWTFMIAFDKDQFVHIW